MRKLCSNLDQEDGLDTVLEVPIPEEMFSGIGIGGKSKVAKLGCTNIKAWMKHTATAAVDDHFSNNGSSSHLNRSALLQLLLGVIGAPLVPAPLQPQRPMDGSVVKKVSLEESIAKYIVQQYIAAVGGDEAINAITSMYAIGKVRMAAVEFIDVDNGGSKLGGTVNSKRSGKVGGGTGNAGEIGGFVFWQKKPDLWCLELVMSGCKLSAGSDGRVAWRQTPWHHSHASRGPPRPLRRSIQGLDPRSTADLFYNAVCIGEKFVNGEDCFVLRLDAEAATLRARSSTNVEIIRHTIWGYFSQRTGLLIQLDDAHLLRIKASATDETTSVYWETTMETKINDYRTVDGVNIAHAGKTLVSLFRFGDVGSGERNARTRMEEVWSIEELDFNIRGLSMDCFLGPSDLVTSTGDGCDVLVKNVKTQITPAMTTVIAMKTHAPMLAPLAMKIGPSKVAAVDELEKYESEKMKLL